MLWSPFEAEHIANPYPMYARLRREDPVHRAQTGEYIITKYSDIKAILKSSNFKSGNRLEWLSRGIDYFKNHDEDLSNIYKAVCSFVLFLNPPDHTTVRGFVMKTWDDRNVEPLITEVVEECLREMKDEFDLVKDFAQPIPARITCRIMGFPIEDHEYLRALGVKIVRSLDLYHTWKDLVELNEACSSFIKYFAEFVRRKPKDGLFGKLMAANEQQKVLRDEQMISIAMFLFIAGEETTAGTIGRTLYHFINNGDIYQQLRKDTSLLHSTALEEAFRFDGPVHLLGRICKDEYTIGNTALPSNSPLTLVLSSANRDEDQFKDPDSFNIHRTPNQHLAFGYGTHFCMGEWLGKLQVRIAVERFIAKYPSVNITSQNIQWLKNIAVRGMSALNVSTKR